MLVGPVHATLLFSGRCSVDAVIVLHGMLDRVVHAHLRLKFPANIALALDGALPASYFR